MSNYHIIVDQSCNGFLRRGIQVDYKNRFVDEKDFKNEPNTFIRDYQLYEKMNDISFKLSFIKLLLERTIKMYKIREQTNTSGLFIPKSLEENFERICYQNDKIKIFLDEHYIRTNDKNDVVSTVDFTKLWKIHFNEPMTWPVMCSKVEKEKITYENKTSCKRADGIISKGAIFGIRLKTTSEREENLPA